MNISLPTFLSGIGTLTISLILGWTLYTRFAHHLHDIPGPFWASFSRYWLGYQVSTGKIDQIQRHLHKKYGSFVRIAPDEVSISDPSTIREIYGIKSAFTKVEFYTPFAPSITPQVDHFTQLDNTKHAARRRTVNHTYSVSTVLEPEKYIDGCIDVFLSKMAKYAAENGQLSWPPGSNGASVSARFPSHSPPQQTHFFH
ncbi:cytochrome P450 [Aspergillus navahoensis]